MACDVERGVRGASGWRFEAVAGFDVAAVDEVGPGHDAAGLGLDFEQFEEAVAGDDVELFADPALAIQQVAAPQYNVSTDGEQFVLREVVGKVATPIWVVQNWYEEFCDPKGPT